MNQFLSRRRLVRRAAATLCLSLIVACVAGPAHAQQRLQSDRYKNGKVIREAFRKVVVEARKATVEILSGNKRVALGAIVDRDGYILTKASELEGSIRCRLDATWVVDANVVGVSLDDDLALIKIDASSLTPVKWHSEDPKVGQWLATAGRDEIPVSVGVVSVKRRNIPRVPGFLGVQIEQHEFGAKVVDVTKDSGAEKAGLKRGDVITWIAGADIRKREDLSNRIREFRPGDSLQMKVLREKQLLALSATLGSRQNLSSRGAVQNAMGGKLSERRAGFAGVLQHDSYLRPEECGGPVVDLKGRVVGVNIARAGRTESYAIPADRILALLPDLMSGKLAPPSSDPKLPPPPPGPAKRTRK